MGATSAGVKRPYVPMARSYNSSRLDITVRVFDRRQDPSAGRGCCLPAESSSAGHSLRRPGEVDDAFPRAPA